MAPRQYRRRQFRGRPCTPIEYEQIQSTTQVATTTNYGAHVFCFVCLACSATPQLFMAERYLVGILYMIHELHFVSADMKLGIACGQISVCSRARVRIFTHAATTQFHTHARYTTHRERERERQRVYIATRSFVLLRFYNIILFFPKFHSVLLLRAPVVHSHSHHPVHSTVAFHRERRATSKVWRPTYLCLTSSGCAEALQDGTASSRNGGCANSPIMFVVVVFCTLMKVVKMRAAMRPPHDVVAANSPNCKQRSTGQHRPMHGKGDASAKVPVPAPSGTPIAAQSACPCRRCQLGCPPGLVR